MLRMLRVVHFNQAVSTTRFENRSWDSFTSGSTVLEALVWGCVVRISAAIGRWYCTVAYLPFTTKMHRNCVSNPDNFCYVCGVLTFKSYRRHFTPPVKNCCEHYFGYKAGDQDKTWTTHMYYATCVRLLTAWAKAHVICLLQSLWSRENPKITLQIATFVLRMQRV